MDSSYMNQSGMVPFIHFKVTRILTDVTFVVAVEVTISLMVLSVRGTSIMLITTFNRAVSTSISSIMMMVVVVLTVVRVVLAYTGTSNI